MFRFLRRRSDDEFAREVETHLAIEIEEQIARGVPPDQARAAAVRAFGNPTRVREDFRERSPWFTLIRCCRMYGTGFARFGALH